MDPLDAETFFGEHWERLPLHVPRSEPSRFDDLLDRDEAERLLAATAIREPGFRLVKAGEQVTGYTEDLSWRPRPFSGTADVRRVLDEWRQGATAVLQGLHLSHAPLAEFSRRLELELAHPVQVNAYYTPREAQGLPVHHDTHDVFVLQISGRKRWLVYEPALELPLRTQRYSADLGSPGPAVMDVMLAPGDTLYLPRGWLHEALTSDDDSLHLTVGVNVVTWLDALRAALDEAGDDLRFRRSIDEGDASDVVEALGERLGRAEVERRRDERLARRSRPLLADGFEQLRRLEHLDGSSLLELRPAHVRLTVEGDEARLLADGAELLFPARVAPELEAVVSSRSAFTAADLPGDLDDEGRLVLVRRLVREGVVRVV